VSPEEASEKYSQKKGHIDGMKQDKMEEGEVKMYDWKQWKPAIFDSETESAEPPAPAE